LPTGSWPAARPRRERQPTETGPGSSGQEIASTLTERRSPDAPIRVGRPASCLSFCLIHLRPAPFTRDRPSRVRAGHGRRWTSVNGGQHCWKACWGNPSRVRISHPPPPLTRQYIRPVIRFGCSCEAAQSRFQSHSLSYTGINRSIPLILGPSSPPWRLPRTRGRAMVFNGRGWSRSSCSCHSACEF
jgi:hypothetical protein